ncbi:MAG: citrate synthase [Alphaproteobacteria bacterium]|nr:citrate synthase [Alphaproteobacteria bacterium]
MTTHRSTNRGIWLDADAATDRLGVKRATLYTYASRGWVRTRSAGGRTREYAAADIDALVARSAAHAGREARASGALRWGEPVLTTAISGIDADGPYYRGIPAVDLVDRSLHDLAGILWDTEIPPWPEARNDLADDLLDLRMRIDVLAKEDADRAVLVPAAELARAGRIVGTLVAGAALPAHPDVTAALALTVDHGLNASTFTARVVASTGADLYACVSAGLAALSGPRHGTASLEVRRLLDALEAHGPGAVVARARDTGGLPGFGHPLYPNGDPRAEVLLERTASAAGVAPLRALIDAVAPLGLRPNLDVGLLAVCMAHDLPASRASLLFAAARSVGWIAHVREQREQPGILRPNSAYRGWGT